LLLLTTMYTFIMLFSNSIHVVLIWVHLLIIINITFVMLFSNNIHAVLIWVHLLLVIIVVLKKYLYCLNMSTFVICYNCCSQNIYIVLIWIHCCYNNILVVLKYNILVINILLFSNVLLWTYLLSFKIFILS
jgi:hypothetical protein